VDPAAITVPVAFWSGACDTMHPTSHSRRLAALIGGARVSVVPDAATFGLLPHYPDALRFAIGRDA
jgi:pimeloyl-ACP methyl ester carboxylesterase